MKLKPLGDRLIVKPIDEEETTASGIVLPDTAKEKPQKGTVVAVGEGKWDEEGDKRIPLDVSEGDEVQAGDVVAVEVHPGRARELATEYDLTYLVTEQPLPSAAAYRNSRFGVYRLR